MKAKISDRGESRQLAAQMYMLYQHRQLNGILCDTKRDQIDDVYYQNLSFDPHSFLAERFLSILNTLTSLLGDGKRSKVINYEAMSLLLLIDSLSDDFTPSWKDRFASAFDEFRLQATLAKSTKDGPSPSDFWLSWGLLARSSSDRADSIERRHAFFVTKMTALLDPTPKDPKRGFDGLQRDLIYARDKKKCQLNGCGGDVVWDEAEIHHVNQHASGGKTSIENGALVHKSCHPKGQEAVAAFAAMWKAKKPSLSVD